MENMFYKIPLLVMIILIILGGISFYSNENYKIWFSSISSSLVLSWIFVVLFIFKPDNSRSHRVEKGDLFSVYRRPFHSSDIYKRGVPKDIEITIKKYVASAIISVILLFIIVYFYFSRRGSSLSSYLSKISKGAFLLWENTDNFVILHKGKYSKDELKYLFNSDADYSLEDRCQEEEWCLGDKFLLGIEVITVIFVIPLAGLYLYTWQYPDSIPTGINMWDRMAVIVMYWVLLLFIPFLVQSIASLGDLNEYGPRDPYFHNEESKLLECGQENQEDVDTKDLSVYEIYENQLSCTTPTTGQLRGPDPCTFIIDSKGMMSCPKSAGMGLSLLPAPLSHQRAGRMTVHGMMISENYNSNCPPEDTVCNKLFTEPCNNGLTKCYSTDINDVNNCESYNQNSNAKEYCDLDTVCTWYESCLDNPSYNGEVNSNIERAYASCSKIYDMDDYNTKVDPKERDLNIIFDVKNNLVSITGDKPRTCIKEDASSGNVIGRCEDTQCV